MPAAAKQAYYVVPRPRIPREHANPHIKHIDPTKPPPVKFQEIVRDGQATVVGRLKIQTPSGHAFILRRLDTGGISLTTMFRAAFPTATDEAERQEAAWVKANFDMNGTNKTGRSRFAGTWVTPEVALALASDYSLGSIIPALVEAEPDPNQVFRRSNRAQQPTPGASPTASVTATRGLPSPPSTGRDSGPAPSKRRREASPAVPVVSLHAPASAQKAAEHVVSPTPPPSTSRVVASPPPRRSARLKSPAATPAPAPSKTPKSTRAPRKDVQVPTPAPTAVGSDETVVDEDAEDLVKLTEETMHDDIREQKELIAKLKAEREQRKGETQVEQSEDTDVPKEKTQAEAPTSKRPREDEEPLKFNFKEPQDEVGERAIATNARVRTGAMRPERKSLAWGALAFAAGLGAMSLLPSLQGYLPF